MYTKEEYDSATPEEKAFIDADMEAQHKSENAAETAWMKAAEYAYDVDHGEEAAMKRDEESYYSRCW